MKKVLWFLSGFSIAMLFVNFEMLPYTALITGLTLIIEIFVEDK